MYFIVQPYGSGAKRTRQATVVAVHPTVEAAYAALDAIAEKLNRKDLPGDYLELLVVDEDRQHVSRPGLQ